MTFLYFLWTCFENVKPRFKSLQIEKSAAGKIDYTCDFRTNLSKQLPKTKTVDTVFINESTAEKR